jgi:hypothetical protein
VANVHDETITIALIAATHVRKRRRDPADQVKEVG